MTVLLAILAELAASEVWERVKERLRHPDPTWAEAVARSIEPHLPQPLSASEREGIARWLARGDVFSALASSTTATLQADAGRVVNALEYELGPPSDSTKELAAEVAAAVIAHITELVDPAVAATLSSHRSLKNDLNDLKLGQVVILDAIQERDRLERQGPTGRPISVEQELVRLPTTVAPWIRLAQEKGADSAAMVTWLRDRVKVRSNISVLVADPPSWLSRCGELWAATAFAAEAFGLNGDAIAAFIQASELLPGFRSEALARAALAAARADDQDRARSLLQRASNGASDAEALFVDVVTSAIAEDVEALEERADLAIRGGVADTTMIRTWLGRAKAAKGDLDGAVVVLEEGLPGSASQAGFLTSFASILLTRAAREDASNRMRDAQRALDFSIAARDIRRLWGGDSAEPTVLACQAAFMLEDFDGIIRLASVHDGEATEEEGADPEVRQLLALTRLIEGGDAPDPAGEFEQAWFRGLALARNPSTRDEAVAEFELAAGIAADERELDRAQRSLANLGKVEIPRLDEVRQRDSDHADVLLAIAEKNAGRADLATTRLRPLVGRNRLAAMQMADLYADAGDVTASAELLREAGQRFSDPRLLLGGARYFLSASNLEESSRCISFALALVPTMSPLRREARWLAVEVAAKSGDAASVEAAASTALSEGELSPSMRWVRVEALTNIHRLKDAWAEVRTAPVLTPDTDERARLFLQLLMRREPARLDLMVEVMDRFRESHDVLATGLSLFFAFDATDPHDQTAVAAMQAHASHFVSTYPESPVMRSMEVTVDDPEKLREQMRQMLQPDIEKDRQVRALSERAASGQLPIGFAASVLGRTYLDTILSGSSITFTSVPRDAATLEEEVLAATAHLDKAIVVDASSLVSMSFLPELWRAVLVAFSSVSIAGASFAEIDDSIFRKPASGSLRWDHEQDTWTMVSIPDDQSESLRTQRDLIRSWATELRVLRTGSLADLPELAGAAGESTWLAALATAREQGCALLCDDVALAALARSLDVPAFGSFAVALALARSGRLEVADLDKFVVGLFKAQADDLPLTPAQLAALSRSLGWPLGPSLHPMTRPHYWRDVQAAHAAYVTTIDGLGATAESTGNALYCASLGVIRGVAVGSPERLIAGLFVSALLRTEADPTIVESLVAATRAACRAYELADPFDACVSALIDVVGSSEDPSFTAQFVTAAFSGLQPEDRSRVTAIILDVSRR